MRNRNKLSDSNIRDTIIKIEAWADNKDLLKKKNSLAQMAKVTEEVGEVASALLKNDKAKLIDGIGDVIVTLVILAAQNDLNLEYCLDVAWNEIKDRKGKTNSNGTFIKD